MNLNPNCDGGHCASATGEVRLLLTGGDSNAILCQRCFRYELEFRRERNRELSPDCQFALPVWSELETYGPLTW